MAIMETKIIQVQNDPATINAANESWAQWGWNVLNLQVTHTQEVDCKSKFQFARFTSGFPKVSQD